MKISHSLRKRFVKDTKLPIRLLQDPYFEYFLDLYENFYGSRTKYVSFCELVDRLGGEDPFFKESKRITDSLIGDISATSAYISFNTCDLTDFNTSPQVKERNIYHTGNVGQAFASFDLVKANYNALKFIDSSIVFNTENYEDLLSKYTTEDYFINSKQIRQIIRRFIFFR